MVGKREVLIFATFMLIFATLTVGQPTCADDRCKPSDVEEDSNEVEGPYLIQQDIAGRGFSAGQPSHAGKRSNNDDTAEEDSAQPSHHAGVWKKLQGRRFNYNTEEDSAQPSHAGKRSNNDDTAEEDSNQPAPFHGR